MEKSYKSNQKNERSPLAREFLREVEYTQLGLLLQSTGLHPDYHVPENNTIETLKAMAATQAASTPARTDKKLVRTLEKEVASTHKITRELVHAKKQIRSYKGQLLYIRGEQETNATLNTDLSSELEKANRYRTAFNLMVDTLGKAGRAAGHKRKITAADFKDRESINSLFYKIAEKTLVNEAKTSKKQKEALLSVARLALKEIPQDITDIKDLDSAGVQELSLGIANIATYLVTVTHNSEILQNQIVKLGRFGAESLNLQSTEMPKTWRDALPIIQKTMENKDTTTAAYITNAQQAWEYLRSERVLVPADKPTDVTGAQFFYTLAMENFSSTAKTLFDSEQMIGTLKKKGEQDATVITNLEGIVETQKEIIIDQARYIPAERTVKNTDLDVIKAAYDTFTGPHTLGNTAKLAKKTVDAMKYAPHLTAAAVSAVITSLEAYFGKDCVVLETIADKICEATRHYRPTLLTFRHAKALKNIVLEKLNIA